MEPEPYIPLRVTDLVDVLLTEAGTPEYAPLESVRHEAFKALAGQVAERIENNYRRLLRTLKDAYAPFDPDGETLHLNEAVDEELPAKLDRLISSFSFLLERGGFHRMTRDEIEATMQGSSYWGIEMDVSWDVFDRVEVFYRGRGLGWRTRRVWWKFFKTQEVELPTYRRVVLVLKQKPHKRLGPHADTKHVFMKVFKDIPTMDIEMLLPGTRLRMPKLERGKLGGSAIGSIFYIIFVKLIPSIGSILSGSLLGLLSPLMVLLGYGYKTLYSFRVSKKSYMLQLTQSLYYQGLDTNAGVLHRLLDEAAEQDIRQTLLAYYFLWRFAGKQGWSAAELDKAVEKDLHKRTGTVIEVDTDEALARLMRLNMVTRNDGRYFARPVEEAMNGVKTLAKSKEESQWRAELSVSPRK